MALIERPYSICFCRNGNEIRYAFQVANLTRPGLALQVKLLYKEIGSSVVNELYTWSLRPATDGKVYIYLQDYLDSVLNYVLPTVTSIVTIANDQGRMFYIHYREITTADIDPLWDTSEEDHQCLVLKGGIEQRKASRNNYFINYFNIQKPFLTWQPATRFIFPNEYCYLTFLNPSLNCTGYQLRTVYYLNDDTSGTYFTPLNVTTAAVVHLRRRIADVQLGKPKPIVYIQMDIINSTGVAVTAPYRFYCEYRPSYFTYDLVYHNSLGGVDFVRVRGDIAATAERDYTEGEKGLDLDQWSKPAKPVNTFQSGTTQRYRFKGDAGYQRTQIERDALIEILVSESLYQWHFNTYVPINVLTKAEDLGKRKDKKYSFPLEWQHSAADSVYTPSYLDLGMGSFQSAASLIAVSDSYTFETNKLEDNVEGSANPLANDESSAGGIRVAGVPFGQTIDIPTAQGGNVRIADNGDFMYTHPAIDFNGTDSCDYTITDSSGATATATILITVD